jgi:hypothetical protein
VDKRSTQFGQSISEAMESQDLEFFKQVIARYQEEHDAADQDVMAALAYLAQKDRPLMPPITAGDAEPQSWKPESHRPEQQRERPTRSDRGDRGELSGRPARSERPERRPRDEGPAAEGVTRYRIAVGHEHGVEPRNIVGAIANEAGLDAEHIGRIKIFDSYSTVDLPSGMPRAIFEQLKKAWVLGQQLNIAAVGDVAEGEPSGGTPSPAPRSDYQGERKPRSKPFPDRDATRKPRSKPFPARDGESRPRKSRDTTEQRPRTSSDERPRSGTDDRPRSAPTDKPRSPGGKFKGKPAGKFAGKPGSKPGARSKAGPGSKSGAKAKPAGKPKVKYTPKPANKFGGKNSKPPGRKVLTTKKS